MQERKVLIFLILMSIASSSAVLLGLEAAMCGTLSFPHDFSKPEERALIAVLWSFPLVFLASLGVSWRSFHSKRFLTACLIQFVPLATVVALFCWFLFGT